MSADLLKANEIIRKLQDTVRQEHAKAKLTARYVAGGRDRHVA